MPGKRGETTQDQHRVGMGKPVGEEGIQQHAAANPTANPTANTKANATANGHQATAPPQPRGPLLGTGALRGRVDVNHKPGAGKVIRFGHENIETGGRQCGNGSKTQFCQ